MISSTTVESPMKRLFPRIIPRLITIDGPLSGRTFHLDESAVSIGRLVSNDICLEDLHVSRRHCVIRTEGDEYMIEDLNSANGTYVNSKLVKVSSLNDGAIIQIGNSRFIFRVQTSEGFVTLSQNLIEAENGPYISGRNRVGVSRMFNRPSVSNC
jgi:pSer/pThr/pTyr-binding forkhead associated (FHA) protein